MIKIQTLEELLNIKEVDLKDMAIDKLRDLLGVLHYASRLVEHEINSRG